MENKHSLYDKLRYLFSDASLATRANTFRSLLGGKLNTTKALGKPWMLQIEVTNRCNMHCVMCSRSSTEMTLGDMAPDLIDKCIELSKDTQETALFGYGEPLLSKAFFAVLGRIRSSRVGFFTNGLMLNDTMMTRILDGARAPLSYIVISMDGATAPTYEGIRIGSNFDKVWANIRNAVKRREREGLDYLIRLEFVAMARNIRELTRLVELANEAGVDGVKVSHLVVWEESLRGENLIFDQALCADIFAQAEEVAKKTGIYLDLPKLIDTASTEPVETYPPCHAPWQYAMISFEGDVRACCFAPQFTMGNLTKENFADIWTSAKYNGLRAKVNSGKPPKPCLTCEERFRLSRSPDEMQTYIKLKPRKK